MNETASIENACSNRPVLRICIWQKLELLNHLTTDTLRYVFRCINLTIYFP